MQCSVTKFTGEVRKARRMYTVCELELYEKKIKLAEIYVSTIRKRLADYDYK